ncbi:MAG: hypothetical protein KAW17_12195, partial [Candidatus Eisenbacteria sp.]|nr:hypothetical protein [Candidatus Eisenbacteria bacterium]
VVIADPWRPFIQDEIDALVTYVSRGGRLLILLDSRNVTQAPRQLLGSLGIRLVAPPEKEEEIEPEPAEPSDQESLPEPDILYIESLDGDRIVAAQRPMGLTGGTPRLRLSDERAVLVETRVGEGRVFVFGDFFIFTDESMGHTGEMLDTRKRNISEMEYWMLREIMEVEQGEPFWKKIHAVP